MGSILSGVFGGGEQTSSETTPDPNAQAMNLARREQLEGLFANTPYADFANARPDLFSLDANSTDIMNQGTDTSNVLSKDDFMSLDEYMKLGTEAGGSFMEQIAGPQIASAMAMQGQEGSGAYGEALAKGAASIGLPFLQSIPQFGNTLANQAQTRTGQYQAMFDMSQMPQQLKQQDYLRQQGVVTTGLTGLPWSPGSKTEGGTSTLPLWNMFGMGGSM